MATAILFRACQSSSFRLDLEAEKDDVDVFIQYSLSVHNRRKSRVGFAFENHLETVFMEHGLVFEKGQSL